MAIEFVDYFESIAPAEIRTLERNVTDLLPELEPVEALYDSSNAGAMGYINKLFVETQESDIQLPLGDITINPSSLSPGQQYVVLCIPMYAGQQRDVPFQYFGVVCGRASGDTYYVRSGYYTDDTCETSIEVVGYNTTSPGPFIISVGMIYNAWQEDYATTYPNKWERYHLAVWGLDTYINTTDDHVTLKSTAYPPTDYYYLQPDPNHTGQIFMLWSLHKYRTYNAGLAGPWKSFLEDAASPEAGPTSGPGGMGQGGDDPTFDDTSDIIAVPAIPTYGVSNVGFIRVYKTGLNSLQTIGVELFPPLQYTAPTAITANDVTEALINGFNQLATFLANIPSFFDQIIANTLINYVIDCHIIPVSPSAGSPEAIQVGPKTLQTSAGRVTSDYVNVSCGSISIREYYANFADFLTTAKLYLPFVGFVPVAPEWFQNETLRVDYHFNIIDGSFTAYVRAGGKYVNNGDVSGTIVGQYGGNACIHLPITGVTYASMVSGLVGAAGGMMAASGSGAIAAAATSAIGAATSHGDIAQSNAYSSSAAFLGCRRPFLMIERPVSNYSKNYQHEVGIPANIYARLGDVPGFVKMENVHVDGIVGATSSEKEEIRRLLSSGVIV